MKDVVIIKAINYIKEHIEEKLTVEDIAMHCHFSKYYFNRYFKSAVGESVYAFIKRLKIEKSAFKIYTEIDKTITQISSEYGYSSSNYSTLFKNHYGRSPIDFKNDRVNKKIISNDYGYYADLSDKDYNYYNDKINIIELEDITVIYQRFIGKYEDLRYQWEDFMNRYKDYYDEDSQEFELSYDDPTLTHPDKCITDICITTSKDIPKNFTTMVLKGGRYAVYRFEGINTELFGTFQGLLGIWMINTPYKVDFESRKIISKYYYVDIENKFLCLDIYIPIY